MAPQDRAAWAAKGCFVRHFSVFFTYLENQGILRRKNLILVPGCGAVVVFYAFVETFLYSSGALGVFCACLHDSGALGAPKA